MPTAPAPRNRAASGGVVHGISRAGAAAAVLVAATCPGMALPARSGVFCAPGGGTVTVDAASDRVEIDGYTCRHPVIAADKLQSLECRRGGGAPERREFAFRLIDPRNLIVHSRWYALCGPVPPTAGVSLPGPAPATAPPPRKP